MFAQFEVVSCGSAVCWQHRIKSGTRERIATVRLLLETMKGRNVADKVNGSPCIHRCLTSILSLRSTSFRFDMTWFDLISWFVSYWFSNEKILFRFNTTYATHAASSFVPAVFFVTVDNIWRKRFDQCKLVTFECKHVGVQRAYRSSSHSTIWLHLLPIFDSQGPHSVQEEVSRVLLSFSFINFFYC